MGRSRSPSGKKLENHRNSPILVCCGSMTMPCVFCLNTLLQRVSHHDLSVCPCQCSVNGFHQKTVWLGWVGGDSSIQFCFVFF